MKTKKIDHIRVKLLDDEQYHNKNELTIKDKRLAKGCTNLMYACQHGLNGEIVKELRNKVLYICICVYLQ